MTKQHIQQLIGLLVFIVVFYSCAQIVPLTGGPKDTTPPKVLRSVPANNTTNFDYKEIKIEFDEYIQLRNLNDELIITPPIKPQPEINIKNKTIVIKLREKLRENATYSINFGNAVVDNNEGNVYKNLKYVFSTDNYVDSLSLPGKIINALTLKPEKGVGVYLYAELGDTTVLYYTKSEADGNFLFENLRQGSYAIFALKDMNRNQIYDSPDEMIGFINTKVTPYYIKPAKPIQKDTLSLAKNTKGSKTDKSVKTPAKEINKSKPKDSIFVKDTLQRTEILIFNEGKTLPRIKKSQRQRNRIDFALSKAMKNPSIRPLLPNTSLMKSLELNKAGDSLSFWLKEGYNDSAKFVIYDNGISIDTLALHKIEKKKAKDSAKLKISAYIKGGYLEQNEDLVLRTSDMARLSKKNAIYLMKDSIKIENLTIIPDSTMPRKHIITNKLDPDANYKLIILPEAFTDDNNAKNDTVRIKFKTRPLDYYGAINITIKSSKPLNHHYIVQLLDDKENLIRHVKTSKSKLSMTAITPGKFMIKVISDDNNNGIWDPGEWKTRRMPEKVYYFNTLIDVKANWDTDIEVPVN